jgi:exodeoxyribonuclease V alpha subunit
MDKDITLSKPLIQLSDLLSSLDRQFATLICRLSGDKASEGLYLAAALASHLTLNGKQTCFDLRQIQERQSITELFPTLFQGHRQTDQDWMRVLESLPVSADWEKQLLHSGMVAKVDSDTDTYKPLILDGTRLYLHRYWQYEHNLAKGFQLKLERNAQDTKGPFRLNPKTLQKDIVSTSSFFHNSDPRDIVLNQQFQAVLTALNSYLTVITGGPGTGKTTIVSVILAVLLQHNPYLRIALCAPTGKAQARLKESLLEEQAHLICPEEVKQRLIGLNPSTIHRLLGSKPDSVFFRHHADRPLNIDLLIVDEVSMVALPLMAKLMEALPPQAPIILLGDQDQLASIENGAVLSEICQTLPLVQITEQMDHTNDHTPCSKKTEQYQISPGVVVKLHTSYRFQENGGIARLQRLITRGQTQESLNQLVADTSGELEYRALPHPKNLFNALETFLFSWKTETSEESLLFTDCLKYSHYSSQERTLLEVSKAYEKFCCFRILCAYRHGPFGVERINQLVRKIIGKTAPYCPGLPIMVTSNAPRLNLFNGDIGLCWPGPDHSTYIYFPSPENK